MTTGRINQVCRMLPRHVQPHGSTARRGSVAKVQEFTQLGRTFASEQMLPKPKELYNLTLKQALPKHPQVAGCKKQKLPANTQITAHCQEAAQYPMSINDHKDTRGKSLEIRCCTKTCPTICRCPISGTPSAGTSQLSRQSQLHPEE